MSRHGITRIDEQAPKASQARRRRPPITVADEDGLPETPTVPSRPERVLALAVIFQALMDLQYRLADTRDRYTAAAFLTGYEQYADIRAFWCQVAEVTPAQLEAQARAKYGPQIHRALLAQAPRVDLRRRRWRSKQVAHV